MSHLQSFILLSSVAMLICKNGCLRLNNKICTTVDKQQIFLIYSKKYLGIWYRRILRGISEKKLAKDMEDDTVRGDAPLKSEIPEGAILIIARRILCHQIQFSICPLFLFNSFRMSLWGSTCMCCIINFVSTKIKWMVLC